jgi:hypothetical protein
MNTSLAQQELKEAKNKMITLQYDLKKRDEEINSLRQQLLVFTSSEMTSSNIPIVSNSPISSANTPSDPISGSAIRSPTSQKDLLFEMESLKTESSHLKQDVLRLQVEKEEALAAGRLTIEQLNEQKKLVKTLLERVDSLSSSNSDLTTIEKKIGEQLETINSLNNQLEELKKTNEQLKKDKQEYDLLIANKHSSIIEEYESKLKSLQQKHQQDIHDWTLRLS